MHDLCKMPWDCHAEHPDFEQTVREITAGEKEAVLQAGLGDLCLPFPKLGSLVRVLLYLWDACCSGMAWKLLRLLWMLF